MLATGPQGSELIGSQLRIVGDKGAVELDAADMPKGMHLRVRGAGDGDWRYPQIEGTLHGDEMFVAAIRDVVDSLRAGRASLLDCHNALRASELIFGTYESSRRRARVDFPLAIEDSPLLSMLDAGLLGK
ncbi:MAG: hypothetical protein BWZ10_02911 [candidate division BRC1 bacterium ADurb.BinA364]|nr:MAG: hypothetical protein BWZ10_02911 [candidate division BRC1 bacterium ADurb.BinA364]